MGKNKENSAEKESASEKTSINEVCGIPFCFDSQIVCQWFNADTCLFLNSRVLRGLKKRC